MRFSDNVSRSFRHALVAITSFTFVLVAGCTGAIGDPSETSESTPSIARMGPESPATNAGGDAAIPSSSDAGVTSDGALPPSDAAPAAPDSAPSSPPSSSPDAGSPTVDSGAPKADSGAPKADSGTPPPADTGTSTSDTGTSSGTTSKTTLGKYVVTWYSFQDNTPVNSALSASGRPLIAYVSVAVPFRLLKDFGGTMNYGDKLYVEFLDGRVMPDGKKHTGWVQIDDYCGDSGDDSYCFQSVGGTKYPNVDLFIGDFTKSGMDSKACTGPAGSGAELTNVSTGTAGSAWIGDYGGSTLGSGKCGDLTTAKAQQGSCWDYTPPSSSISECAGCAGFSCTSW